MRVAALLVGALLVVAPLSDAAAQQQQHLSAQDEANARFQTGLKYYDARDFESARIAFTQAYAVLQKPGILLNLALSELYSNHVLEAIPHFEQYIKDPTTPSDKRDAAKKHLDEALKRTGHLQVRTAADAEVKLDGRPLSPPYSSLVHVQPGTHALEARLGDKTKQATIDAKPGDTVAVDLVFENAPPEPVAPPSPSASATVSAAETTTPAEPAPSPSAARWIVPAALGVLALGGLAVGIGFASAHDSTLDDAESLRRAGPSNICADRASPQCQAYESKLSDASTQTTISTIGYISAAVLAAGAIATFFFWPKPSPTKTSFVVTPFGATARF